MSNRRKRFIPACVRSTTQRRARSPGRSRVAGASSPRCRLCAVSLQASRGSRTASSSYPWSQHRGGGCVTVGAGRLMMMAAKVASPHCISWQWAPATAMPRGRPGPSVSTRRVVPSVPRSVGCLPTLFPPQRGLGHRAVHRRPRPLQAFPRSTRQPPRLPEPLEHRGGPPLLQPVMHRTGSAQAARQRCPWATGAPHLDQGGHRVPVLHPGPSIFLADVGRREDAHHLRPQRIRDLVVGAHPLGVITHLGALLSGHGGTKYTEVHTFRIDSKSVGMWCRSPLIVRKTSSKCHVSPGQGRRRRS